MSLSLRGAHDVTKLRSHPLQLGVVYKEGEEVVVFLENDGADVWPLASWKVSLRSPGGYG